jgi:hypothetical protein
MLLAHSLCHTYIYIYIYIYIHTHTYMIGLNRWDYYYLSLMIQVSYKHIKLNPSPKLQMCDPDRTHSDSWKRMNWGMVCNLLEGAQKGWDHEQ